MARPLADPLEDGPRPDSRTFKVVAFSTDVIASAVAFRDKDGGVVDGGGRIAVKAEGRRRGFRSPALWLSFDTLSDLVASEPSVILVLNWLKPTPEDGGRSFRIAFHGEGVPSVAQDRTVRAPTSHRGFRVGCTPAGLVLASSSPNHEPHAAALLRGRKLTITVTRDDGVGRGGLSFDLGCLAEGGKLLEQAGRKARLRASQGRFPVSEQSLERLARGC